jgi:hypothetical protein
VITIHKEGKVSHFNIGYNWKIIIYIAMNVCIAGQKKHGKEQKADIRDCFWYLQEKIDRESLETCIGEEKIV